MDALIGLRRDPAQVVGEVGDEHGVVLDGVALLLGRQPSRRPTAWAAALPWTSQAAFDKFGETLLPILQEIGVDPGQPSVMEIHNEITPPAKARPAKKRATVKPAAARRRARPRKRR